MATKTVYRNIPLTGFDVHTQETSKTTKVVELNERGRFKLSAFSLMQLIVGSASLIINQNLLTKLMEWLYNVQNNGDHYMELTHAEVRELYHMLLVRMQHCEQERDTKALRPTGEPKFNPDTYIAQKLLLLEIKEWLIGEITVEKPDVEESTRKLRQELRQLSGIEAWITDAKMKKHFQDILYPIIQIDKPIEQE